MIYLNDDFFGPSVLYKNRIVASESWIGNGHMMIRRGECIVGQFLHPILGHFDECIMAGVGVKQVTDEEIARWWTDQTWVRVQPSPWVHRVGASNDLDVPLAACAFVSGQGQVSYFAQEYISYVEDDEPFYYLNEAQQMLSDSDAYSTASWVLKGLRLNRISPQDTLVLRAIAPELFQGVTP